MDYFKETEWSGFFVSSTGLVNNQTGIESAHRIDNNGDIYVGLKYNGKRSFKKLADLIYVNHVRGGRSIPLGYTVSYKDNNPNNVKVENLILIPIKRWNEHLPYIYSTV